MPSLLLLLACTSSGSDSGSGSVGDTGSPELVVAIEPATPGTVDVLQAQVQGLSESDERSWEWYRDNVRVADLDGPMVPADYTARGETWRVIVLPELEGWADQAVSAKVEIANTAPVVEAVELTSEPDVSSSIVASVTWSDVDDDSIVLAFSWAIDGEPVDGQEGSSLPAGLALRDQVVQVTVTPSDDGLEGGPASAEVTVGNTPPSVASATFGTTWAGTDETITVQTSGWHDPDGDAETYSYAWYIDGEPLEHAEPSLDLAGQAVDSVVHCMVTPTDGRDQGEPVSTELLLVTDAKTHEEE